jgi:hypothetical protein
MARLVSLAVAAVVLAGCSAGGKVGPPGPAGILGILQLPFQPTAVAAGCGVALGGATSGSTASTTPSTIGTMFFDQVASDPGLGTTFTTGRLVVLCRGDGTFALTTNDCVDVVTTVTCSGGVRPWTVSSVEFALPAGYTDYNLQAAANTGTLEWTNPVLVIY